MNKYKLINVFVICEVVLLFGCGRQKSGGNITIGMDDVVATLNETGDMIDETLNNIEQCHLSLADRYQFTAQAASLLQQQNTAYALLCSGELMQAISEADELRVSAARLAERVEISCTREKGMASSYDIKTKFEDEWSNKREPKHIRLKESTEKRKVLPQSGDVKVKEKEKIDYPKKNAIDETKWSWKIAGKNIKEKWNETELHVPSATPITITVYNNGKETPVVWDWHGGTSIQTPDVKSRITELSSMTFVVGKVLRGVICFYPQGHPEQRKCIKLYREF